MIVVPGVTAFPVILRCAAPSASRAAALAESTNDGDASAFASVVATIDVLSTTVLSKTRSGDGEPAPTMMPSASAYCCRVEEPDNLEIVQQVVPI